MTLRTIISLCRLLLLPERAAAANKLLSEGIAASSYTVFVDTANRRVSVATDTYRGGEIGVGLNTSSNVVVSADPSNAVVLYATGSVKAKGIFFNDGTSQTTAAGATTSSTTYTLAQVLIPATSLSFTNTQFACQAGTITATVPISGGGTIWCLYSGFAQPQSTNNENFDWTCDGKRAVPSEPNYSQGIVQVGAGINASAGAGENYALTVISPLFTGESAGTHQCCLEMSTGSNTGYIFQGPMFCVGN